VAKHYIAVPINHNPFYNFKKLASAYIPNKKMDTDGCRIKWLEIHCIQVSKSIGDIMHFKTNLENDGVRILKLVGLSREGIKSCP